MVNIKEPILSANRMFLLADGEESREVIRIRSQGRSSAITVGNSALDRGVLLGRYERCDNHELKVYASKLEHGREVALAGGSTTLELVPTH